MVAILAEDSRARMDAVVVKAGEAQVGPRSTATKHTEGGQMVTSSSAIFARTVPTMAGGTVRIPRHAIARLHQKGGASNPFTTLVFT